MSARQEIADEISGIRVGSGYESVTIGVDAALEIADSLIAAGYSKPTTVTTVEELEALPAGVVVHSADGTIAARFDQTYGTTFGDDRPFSPWKRLALPTIVLYTPSETS